MPAIIYLVHGTWGRGIRAGKTLFGGQSKPAWSESGSPFYIELSRQLVASGFEPRLYSFNWSGSNSVLVRDAEAQRLGKLLDEDAANHPESVQVVISHSHGGNIALEAARHYRRSICELHLVTLATPFIDLWLPVRKFDDQGRATQEFGKAFYQGSTLSKTRRRSFALALTILGFWAANLFGISLSLSEIIERFLSTSGLKFAAVWYFTDMAITFILTGTGAVDDALTRVPGLASPPMAGLAHTRILVLRGTDDEAGLALAAGTVQAVLGSRIWRAALPISALLTLHPVIVALFSKDWLRVQSLFVDVLRAEAVFLAGSLLEALGRATTGREFLLTGALVKISVNSAPDFAGDITVRTLSAVPRRSFKFDFDIEPSARSLPPRLRPAAGTSNRRFWNRVKFSLSLDFQFKHALYGHPGCVAAMMSWLRRAS